jgi:hypothetical protein
MVLPLSSGWRRSLCPRRRRQRHPGDRLFFLNKSGIYFPAAGKLGAALSAGVYLARRARWAPQGPGSSCGKVGQDGKCPAKFAPPWRDTFSAQVPIRKLLAANRGSVPPKIREWHTPAPHRPGKPHLRGCREPGKAPHPGGAAERPTRISVLSRRVMIGNQLIVASRQDVIAGQVSANAMRA